MAAAGIVLRREQAKEYQEKKKNALRRAGIFEITDKHRKMIRIYKMLAVGNEVVTIPGLLKELGFSWNDFRVFFPHGLSSLEELSQYVY